MFAPAFIRTAPPRVPGIPQRGANPPNPSFAASAASRESRIAAPHSSRVPSCLIPEKQGCFNRRKTVESSRSEPIKFVPAPKGLAETENSRRTIRRVLSSCTDEGSARKKDASPVPELVHSFQDASRVTERRGRAVLNLAYKISCRGLLMITSCRPFWGRRQVLPE